MPYWRYSELPAVTHKAIIEANSKTKYTTGRKTITAIVVMFSMTLKIHIPCIEM